MNEGEEEMGDGRGEGLEEKNRRRDQRGRGEEYKGREEKSIVYNNII